MTGPKARIALENGRNGAGLTRPWMPDEYILVDGQRYVYTGDAPDLYWIQVQLPGCESNYAIALKERGHTVVMPSIFRRS